MRRYNADLANDLGNLVNRTVSMSSRYLDGSLPPVTDATQAADRRAPRHGRAQVVAAYHDAMARHHLDEALAAMMELAGAANGYAEGQAPWSLEKAGDEARAGQVLAVMARGMPHHRPSARARGARPARGPCHEQLGAPPPYDDARRRRPRPGRAAGVGRAGRRHWTTGTAIPIFPRIEAGGRRPEPSAIVPSDSPAWSTRTATFSTRASTPTATTVIARAVEAGIERILVPGWDLAVVGGRARAGERHPGVIDAGAVGVHPHHAAEADEAHWARARGAASADPRYAAVGEIGLDFFRNLSPPEVQREAFARQLALAARRAACRCSSTTATRTTRPTAALSCWPWAPRRGVLHAFSGDAAMARRLAERRLPRQLRASGRFGSATGPRAAAAALPDGTFLVETDSPYLGPDAARPQRADDRAARRGGARAPARGGSGGARGADSRRVRAPHRP